MSPTTSSTCPAHRSFDPFAADYLHDPYPHLAQVRAEAPAFHAPDLDMWVVTRYVDIERIFTDPGTFSAAIAQDPIFPLADEARTTLRDGGFRAGATMSSADPPKHTRIRRHNLRAFSARRTGALEPKVRAKAEELATRMVSGRRFDVVEELTFPLPAYMIFTLIGFPPEDTEMLKSWCGNRMAFSWGLPSATEQSEIATNMARYWRYCEQFVADRLADPQDDFTSDHIRVHLDDPEQLSIDEIIGVIYGLSFAGHETTTNLTTNTIRRLLEHRDQWEALCADPSLITNAVEEVLRFDTSVLAWRRITTQPVRIGDVDVPAGAKLMLLLGSADRDADRFPDPDTFDIRRPDAARHLAFGKGIHFCLGAPLARMEVRIVLELLTSLAPDLALVRDQQLTFPPNISFRGPQRLLLERT
ncbi:cytochrome P450 [Pseudonocardia xinjiangensis]|uniref:cytochrome P450 n=1 Tax=Pseudonocardia xinjiangensis TaxID=75289 RepID=UPI003D8BE956